MEPELNASNQIFAEFEYEGRFDIRHHLGLDNLTFHKVANMLKSSYKKNGISKDPIIMLRQRFHPDLLPHLRTAKPATKRHRIHTDDTEGWSSDEEVFTTLPGIGHAFWEHAKAHLFDLSPPPSFSEVLISSTTFTTDSAMELLIAELKIAWANTPEVTMPRWDKIKMYKFQDKLVARLPILESFDTFQNGEEVTEPPSILFHGTRETNVPLIMRFGLRSSGCSHGKVGLWLNSKLENALSWNTSAMDILPALCFEVAAYEPLLHQNRRTMGRGTDRHCRFVLKLNEQGVEEEDILPKCKLTSIIFGVPSSARLEWNSQLRRGFEETVQYMISLPLQHDLTNFHPRQFCILFYEFTSFRLAYRTAPGSMDKSFGGFYDRIPTCMIEISIAFTFLVYALQLESLSHRAEALSDIQMEAIPQPLRNLIASYFPSIFNWTSCTRIQDCTKTEWRIGPMSTVLPWSPVVVPNTEVGHMPN